MYALQEGSHDNAKSAVSSFQSLVSNQLAKMEKDFQSGKAFPDLPIIRDTKAFQVPPRPTCCMPCALEAPQEPAMLHVLCTQGTSGTGPWQRQPLVLWLRTTGAPALLWLHKASKL